MACRGWLVVSAILAGHGVVAGVAYLLWVRVLGLPPVVVWPLLPFSLCVVAGSLVAAWEAVRLVGGVDRFFCGGHAVVMDLLGLGRAEPPWEPVTGGVYALVRHPAYSASLAAYLGLCASVPWLVAGLPLLLAWLLAAVWAEDRVNMRSRAYRVYARGRPGLAPHVVAWYGLRRCLLALRGGATRG